MTVNHILMVGIGGFFGAISRFWISQAINKRIRPKIPVATLLINLLGSLLLGIMVGLGLNGNLFMLLGTGFMGAFTTFSTFKLEGIQLHIERRKREFFLYNFFSYGGGILLAFIGLQLGLWLA
ncbi:fluoride efflux transporter CrcB [Mesobacillus sp. AQ2]|uniref:fluoride efflux transporter CrcB n=1 Tax=Bacillaceae TaxID=186817 RepID=UPI0011A2830E|nr:MULTISPECIES: fluoride efflux transporter CrcB [Bacillaceae]MCM3125705.1 fluoride efflux transporter CrcB [Mesobacillus sp. MER 33]MCM3235726.1 fluoride efflux transporter CrcB [Mesobacillus sp. MER 48]WHX40796.1 fluoride efflux transporter CrcB [Mesobacillus sp. AQ2]